ncbi:MAG: 3-hydroxyacyl-[acyl-carrier-protein] dehydratase FabZ [Deltaproteobacteria bacterium]|nr:MAG: 3-hydroxyacyl-[acyl-carrier-protein] dehydratase FabZ [Deltaproteobacteria bacterium]
MQQPALGEIVSKDILDLLPHRYPFILVDRVLSIVPLDRIKAIKGVTLNEPFFQGHFPTYPVMPGVLILEALAQTGGILVAKSIPLQMENKIFLFTGIEKVRFRQSVFPGDLLELEATYLKHKRNLWKIQGIAKVGGNKVAEGLLTAAVVDREDG